MHANRIDRRKALTLVAAAPVAVALAAPAVAATERGDAKLRQLWGEYVAALAASNEAHEAYLKVRSPYDAEYNVLKHRPEYERSFGDLHQMLWEKYGLEPYHCAWEKKGCELRRLAKAVRKAKAESLFGIGVKLSVLEGSDEEDQLEAREDALGALGELAGFDFLAASAGGTE